MGESNGNVRTEKCNKQNKKFSRQAQQQNGEHRGKEIRELEDRILEITQSEKEKENRLGWGESTKPQGLVRP